MLAQHDGCGCLDDCDDLKQLGEGDEDLEEDELKRQNLDTTTINNNNDQSRRQHKTADISRRLEICCGRVSEIISRDKISIAFVTTNSNVLMIRDSECIFQVGRLIFIVITTISF